MSQIALLSLQPFRAHRPDAFGGGYNQQRLVRVYLVNITEFDLINSFHLHGMFFDAFRTGTGKTPSDHTDTITLCQGERAILETTFRYKGDFMFHAHQSEFAELGWMGMFRAEDPRRES